MRRPSTTRSKDNVKGSMTALRGRPLKASVAEAGPTQQLRRDLQ